MHIKSIVAGAAIALSAGVGSVTANEFYVADTAGDPASSFAMLDGIVAEQMSGPELAKTQGSGGWMLTGGMGRDWVTGDRATTSLTQRDGDTGFQPEPFLGEIHIWAW